MDIVVQLFSAEFRWLWIEIGKNAGLSFILALPLAIASKKIWPITVSVLIGVFAIDLHGYSKVISSLGFDIQPQNGRTIVNSYGFELLLISGIYMSYIITTLSRHKVAEWLRTEEKYSLLILVVAIGFQTNIFIDTLIRNDGLYYEPLTTFLNYFTNMRITNLPKTLLWAYMFLFLFAICVFSWKSWQLRTNRT